MTNKDYQEDERGRTLAHEYAQTPLDPPMNVHNGHKPDDGNHDNGGNGGGSGGGGGGNQPTARYEQNDNGNARRLLDAHREDMRYAIETERYHVWTGNAWEEDRANRVQTWVQDIARTMWIDLAVPNIPRNQMNDMAKWALDCGNMGRVRGAVNAAALDQDVKMHLAEFDTHPWLLPCANGLTYDLTTGELRESRRGDYMTTCLPIAASVAPVPHPKWDTVLKLVMADDADMVSYLRFEVGPFWWTVND
jgi:putative DNA primase/helicase